MNEEYKKTLRRQLHLLSESSENADSNDLPSLTNSMIQIIQELSSLD